MFYILTSRHVTHIKKHNHKNKLAHTTVLSGTEMPHTHGNTTEQSVKSENSYTDNTTCMKIRGNVVGLSFILPHSPEDKNKKNENERRKSSE